MPKSGIPKRVFAVVAALVVIAFLLGLSLSIPLTNTLAPYIFFGREAGIQGITIVQNHRHSMTFSNGVTVTGGRLLPLDLVWAALSAAFILGLSFVLLRLTALVARKRHPVFADDILHSWRFER